MVTESVIGSSPRLRVRVLPLSFGSKVIVSPGTMSANMRQGRTEADVGRIIRRIELASAAVLTTSVAGT